MYDYGRTERAALFDLWYFKSQQAKFGVFFWCWAGAAAVGVHDEPAILDTSGQTQPTTTGPSFTEGSDFFLDNGRIRF